MGARQSRDARSRQLSMIAMTRPSTPCSRVQIYYAWSRSPRQHPEHSPDRRFHATCPAVGRILGLVVAAGLSVTMAASLRGVTNGCLVAGGLARLPGHPRTVCSCMGWLLSSSEVLTSFLLALLGGVIYRFATAERKSSFFRGAVALFVGKQVAQSLDQSQKIVAPRQTPDRHHTVYRYSRIYGFLRIERSRSS